MNKIMVIGVGLHEKRGSNITVLNLFRFFEKEQICILCNRENAHLSYNYGFKNIFVFGQHWKPIEETNIVTAEGKLCNPFISKEKHVFGYLKRLKKYLCARGLYYRREKSRLTPSLMSWIIKQKPTAIYSVGSYNKLTMRIGKVYNIPIVLHIQDDFITTMIKPSILSWYWKGKLNREFNNLINQSSKLIAISEKMAAEYKKRYGREWLVMHNPLDLGAWLPYQKNEYNISKTFRIVYFGWISEANRSIINAFSSIIESYSGNLQVELHIYSQKGKALYNRVYFHDFVSHEKLPEVISKYDLLLLPFLYEDDWFHYARLSMPSKASEYFITGIPVWLIAQKDTALHEFCSEEQCAFISESMLENDIISMLELIVEREDLRKEYAARSKQLAVERFGMESVSARFINLF